MRLQQSLMVAAALALSTIGLYSGKAWAQLPTEAEQTAPVQCPAGNAASNTGGSFQGDRAVTRYEFAAGLNAFFCRVEQLLESSNYATRDDLEAFIQRQQELNNELGGLRDRTEAPAREELN